MKKLILVLVIILLIIGGILIWFLRKNQSLNVESTPMIPEKIETFNQDIPQNSTSLQPLNETTTSSFSEATIKEIKITLTSNGFSPQKLELQTGQTYNLIVENKTNDFHFMTWNNAAWQSPPFAGPLPPNSQSIYTFNPSLKGSFKFYCNLPPHEGLNESIIVEIK